MQITVTPEELRSYQARCSAWCHDLMQHMQQQIVEKYDPKSGRAIDADKLTEARAKYVNEHPFPKILPNI